MQAFEKIFIFKLSNLNLKTLYEVRKDIFVLTETQYLQPRREIEKEKLRWTINLQGRIQEGEGWSGATPPHFFLDSVYTFYCKFLDQFMSPVENPISAPIHLTAFYNDAK